MQKLVPRFKALSDPTRLRALMLLEQGELCVCDLAERLALAQSTVSRHLSLLRQAGLVEARKQGLWVYYRLPEPSADPQTTLLLKMVRQSLDDDPQIQADRALASVDPSNCGRNRPGEQPQPYAEGVAS